MNANVTDVFFVLDLDRTLIDTLRSAAIYIDVVKAVSSSLSEEVDNELQRNELMGTSFSIHAFVRERIPEGKLHKIEAAYLAEARTQDLLTKNAYLLLEWLEAEGRSYGILSYGSENGQDLKLKGAKLDHIPRIITLEPDKGRVIASWLTEDGLFQIPKELDSLMPVVETVVLVDDKQKSFAGLPENARGYWFTQKTLENPAENIHVVHDLSEIINQEQLIDKP